MEPSEANENAKAVFLASQTKQVIAALLAMLSSFVCLILPGYVPSPYGQVVMVVGGAAGFSAQFALCPELLRSRSGSLKPAFCLLGFLWLCAAATTLDILFSFR